MGRQRTGSPQPDAAAGRPARIEDIAAAAGVSVATVSRALRARPNVAPATRRRVLEAASALEYEAHPLASRLASGRTLTVGVVAPLFGTWFPHRALGGIHTVLATAGYDLLISVTNHADDRRRFLEGARSFCRRVDGIVLIDAFVGVDGDLPGVLAYSRVTSVGERLRGASSITIDNRAAARRAVEHLIESGHESIGLIAGTEIQGVPSSAPSLRRSGYRDALEAAGLTVDRRLEALADWSAGGGARAMAQLMGSARPPTAVFCMSDELAFGALRTARRAGLAVPADLSVVGFDDHELAEALGLTTMRQAVEEMGVRAAETVLGMIERDEARSDIRWEVPLVVRDSTARAG
ncbi:MAG: LacI family DNA-binding transcriptional regulator [bacterium]|nr:LacI family DNA-binding transcriptional regulator [bacterium]